MVLATERLPQWTAIIGELVANNRSKDASNESSQEAPDNRALWPNKGT